MTDLATALATVDAGDVLEGFYAVIPLVLSIGVPILAAKVGLGFLFGMVKGV